MKRQLSDHRYKFSESLKGSQQALEQKLNDDTMLAEQVVICMLKLNTLVVGSPAVIVVGYSNGRWDGCCCATETVHCLTPQFAGSVRELMQV